MMTVNELIQKLQDAPQDAVVLVCVHNPQDDIDNFEPIIDTGIEYNDDLPDTGIVYLHIKGQNFGLTKDDDTLDYFLNQYIATALWSSLDSDGDHLDENYDESSIHPNTLKIMRKDCQQFFDDMKIGEMPINLQERAAHDFWLTRNHHGSGFWDGDWAEPLKTTLTNHCKKFKEVHLEVTDDDEIVQS